MIVVAITRLTLAEAVKRRLVVAGTLVSLLFAALFVAGFAFLDARTDDPAGTVVSMVASTLLTVFGLYSVYFLAGLLAVLLAAGAVSGEIDAGTLQAVLARPVSRGQYVLGRWLGLVVLVAAYVVLMAGTLFVAARLIAGYTAVHPWAAVALLVLQAVALLSLALLGSTVLPTVANGIVVLSLFGLAWLGGIIGTLGRTLGNTAMTTLATVVGVAVPSDTVWRGASYYAQSGLLAAAGELGAVPFVAADPPGLPVLAWSVAYPLLLVVAAAVALSRRDL